MLSFHSNLSDKVKGSEKWADLETRQVLQCNCNCDCLHVILGNLFIVVYYRLARSIFSAKFCKVLQGSSRFCKVLQGSARFCKILQSSARFCMQFDIFSGQFDEACRHPQSAIFKISIFHSFVRMVVSVCRLKEMEEGGRRRNDQHPGSTFSFFSIHFPLFFKRHISTFSWYLILWTKKRI